MTQPQSWHRCRSIKDLGHTVYRVRQNRGLTQTSVARKIGATRQWLSRVERGHSPGADIDLILKLLDVLDIELFTVDPLQSDVPTAIDKANKASDAPTDDNGDEAGGQQSKTSHKKMAQTSSGDNAAPRKKKRASRNASPSQASKARGPETASLFDLDEGDSWTTSSLLWDV